MSTTTATQAPRRVYDLGRWDLSEMVPDASETGIQNEIERLEAKVVAFEGDRDQLAPDMDPDVFIGLLDRYEEIVQQLIILGSFARLRFSADTQDSAAIALRNRMDQLLTELDNRILFFGLWWTKLSDEEAARLLPDAADQPDFNHYLQDMRRFKDYTLDERSEQLINTKNTNGIQAVITLYQMICSRLEFQLEVDGKTETLTEDEMRSRFFSPHAEVREKVYKGLFRVYGAETKVLSQIYANRVRDWYNDYVELRGYASPVSVRNVWNDVPDPAVDTLLETVRRNAPLFQEYFGLKAKWLGLERPRRYDVYARLAASDRLIPYSDAVASVLDTFDSFDPNFGALAERVFAEDHMDSEVRKGKRGGAFCSTIAPTMTPWVLVNYSGRVRDVATIAHELGHAIHSMLAGDHSVLTQHASLPLAETASVFAEMLMTDRLLAQEDDPLTRRELLAAAVDDVYASVLRQASFVRFEIDAHKAILENCSDEALHEIFFANLRQQFGDEMDIDPDFRYEWVSISHLFQTPFYCYAYAFGQLLVLALYRRYQQQGERFKPGYIRLLSHGGAARPEAVLRELDIDITDAAFWQGGFDIVRGWVDELKTIDV